MSGQTRFSRFKYILIWRSRPRSFAALYLAKRLNLTSSVTPGDFTNHESWVCRARFAETCCVRFCYVCVRAVHLCAHIRTVERQDLDISCNKLWELSPRDRPGFNSRYLPTRFSVRPAIHRAEGLSDKSVHRDKCTRVTVTSRTCVCRKVTSRAIWNRQRENARKKQLNLFDRELIIRYADRTKEGRAKNERSLGA